MAESTFRVLQVTTADLRGGATVVAWNLFQSYRARGHESWLAVGHKRSHDGAVLIISNGEQQGPWARFWWGIHFRLQSVDFQGIRLLKLLARRLAEPRGWVDDYRGIEDFRFPGSWCLLRLTPRPPDILHCHNLHGAYFDLRALSWLSRQVPTILTLHDAWLLSGHCAHSLDCERWKIGCGQCPDLTLYPAIRRDATAYNWQRKREIFSQSRLYLATPSQWLMRKVKQSMLVPAIIEARVIPNGVDLSVFRPADKEAVRAALGIPQDAKVLLFAANGIRRNIWKDYKTMQATVAMLSDRLHELNLLFIALGEDAPPARIGSGKICFVPYQKAPEAVARYYQAADVYVHATKADTFPNTILEALACGTPVVATAVGGIPEQVKGLETEVCSMNRYRLGEATGFLTPPSDAEALAVSVERLLSDESLRQGMGKNAVRDSRSRFDLEQQVGEYLKWYNEICLRFSAERSFMQPSHYF